MLNFWEVRDLRLKIHSCIQRPSRISWFDSLAAWGGQTEVLRECLQEYHPPQRAINGRNRCQMRHFQLINIHVGIIHQSSNYAPPMTSYNTSGISWEALWKSTLISMYLFFNLVIYMIPPSISVAYYREKSALSMLMYCMLHFVTSR